MVNGCGGVKRVWKIDMGVEGLNMCGGLIMGGVG